MKLTENEIENIVDDASQCIYDDLWSEVDTEWIEDYLFNNSTNEYDSEDLNEILERLQNIQREMQEENISEEKETLYQDIDALITDTATHLSLTDIGTVLVKLAASYL